MSLSPRDLKLVLDYQQEKNDENHNGVEYFTDTTNYRVTFEKGKAVQYFHYKFLEHPHRQELKNHAEPNKPVNLVINRNDTSLYAVGASRDKYHHSSLSSGESVHFAAEGYIKKHTPGIFSKISDQSGHYRPKLRSMVFGIQEMLKQGADLSETTIQINSFDELNTRVYNSAKQFVETYQRYFKSQHFVSEVFKDEQKAKEHFLEQDKDEIVCYIEGVNDLYVLKGKENIRIVSVFEKHKEEFSAKEEQKGKVNINSNIGLKLNFNLSSDFHKTKMDFSNLHHDISSNNFFNNTTKNSFGIFKNLKRNSSSEILESIKEWSLSPKDKLSSLKSLNELLKKLDTPGCARPSLLNAFCIVVTKLNCTDDNIKEIPLLESEFNIPNDYRKLKSKILEDKLLAQKLIMGVRHKLLPKIERNELDPAASEAVNLIKQLNRFSKVESSPHNQFTVPLIKPLFFSDINALSRQETKGENSLLLQKREKMSPSVHDLEQEMKKEGLIKNPKQLKFQ